MPVLFATKTFKSLLTLEAALQRFSNSHTYTHTRSFALRSCSSPMCQPGCVCSVCCACLECCLPCAKGLWSNVATLMNGFRSVHAYPFSCCLARPLSPSPTLTRRFSCALCCLTKLEILVFCVVFLLLFFFFC